MVMAVDELNWIDAQIATAAALGLDSGVALGTTEGLAAALRHAASFLCPVTPARLAGAVTARVQPLLGDQDDLRCRVDELVDALVGYGDLVEIADASDGRNRRLLFLGYPRFVRREADNCILIGIRPEAGSLVGEELMHRVEHRGHMRRLKIDEATVGDLEQYGLVDVAADRWLRAPAAVSSAEFLRHLNEALDRQPASGDIAELRIMDPNSPVTYYRGRWRAPTPKDHGRFVARRSQSYGADLWCYVELIAGISARFVDLPLDARERACDEAWRLEAAIDAVAGKPQPAYVHGSGEGKLVIGIASPLPTWLQRRWDFFGEPARSKGSLFAYRFSARDAREELKYAKEMLWLEPVVKTEAS